MADLEECQEEQQMEMEALESIYAEDFKVLDAEYPAKYSIRILPTLEPNEEIHVSVTLEVTYKKLYPSELPYLSVIPDKGVTAAQKQILQALANSTAEDNIDTPLVFAVAEALKDWLVENNQPEKTMHDQMLARKQKKKADMVRSTRELQEETNAKKVELRKYGTPCTRETFDVWLAKFKQEKEESKEPQSAAEAEAESKLDKLTGKQIFEQRLNEPAKPAKSATSEADKEAFYFDEDLYDDPELLDDEDI